jgi:hypothetical protein
MKYIKELNNNKLSISFRYYLPNLVMFLITIITVLTWLYLFFSGFDLFDRSIWLNIAWYILMIYLGIQLCFKHLIRNRPHLIEILQDKIIIDGKHSLQTNTKDIRYVFQNLSGKVTWIYCEIFIEAGYGSKRKKYYLGGMIHEDVCEKLGSVLKEKIPEIKVLNRKGESLFENED